MKFNKQDLKKRMLQGLSGGLIALMIASNVACDKTTTMSVNEWLDDQKYDGKTITGMGEAEAKKYNSHICNAIDGKYMPTNRCVEYEALPINFLKELGVIEQNSADDGHWVLKGDYDDDRGGFVDEYYSAYAQAYANPNENTIHVILRVSDLATSTDAYYDLKYDVGEEVIDTFKALNRDFREAFFIQWLDETHKRTVESEAVLSGIYASSLKILPKEQSSAIYNGITYVKNVDFENRSITYVYQTNDNGAAGSIHTVDNDKLVEYTCRLEESQAMENFVNNAVAGGISVEEAKIIAKDEMVMEGVETPLGYACSKFAIGNFEGNATQSQRCNTEVVVAGEDGGFVYTEINGYAYRDCLEESLNQ